MPLRLAVSFHNVDSVTYVTIDKIMLPYSVLYSRRSVAFYFYKFSLTCMRFILQSLILYTVIWEDLGINLRLCNPKVLMV